MAYHSNLAAMTRDELYALDEEETEELFRKHKIPGFWKTGIDKTSGLPIYKSMNWEDRLIQLDLARVELQQSAAESRGASLQDR